MTYRVLFRVSLNDDTGSKVRAKIESKLVPASITQSGSTGTWEGRKLPASALAAMKEVLEVLQNLPGSVVSANPAVALDHCWLYVDRD